MREEEGGLERTGERVEGTPRKTAGHSGNAGGGGAGTGEDGRGWGRTGEDERG